MPRDRSRSPRRKEEEIAEEEQDIIVIMEIENEELQTKENAESANTENGESTINVEQGVDNKYHCSQCPKMYTRNHRLKLHVQQAHGLPSTKDRHKQACDEPGCQHTFYKRKDLVQHQKIAHKIEFDERNFQFDTMEDFYHWKEQEEISNHVYFTKQGSKKKGTTTYLFCQFDGHIHSHKKKGEPHRKTDRRQTYGVLKTGLICPARIIVTEKATTVEVEYIATHNHDVKLEDTKHQSLKIGKNVSNEWFVHSLNLPGVSYTVKKIVDDCLCEEERTENDL
ncbi:uncharacterized protein [Clytia hemisphaerica]|uniref:uncharacterized protein isoform X2 n=1 Tax=Clytia hemisphaerica TaxID=252671 RepID=UPI0034D5D577